MTSTEFSVKRYKQALSASQTLTDEFSHWFKWKKAAEDDPASINADNNKVTPSLSCQTFRITLTTCNIKQENDSMISIGSFGSDTNDSVTPTSASSSETSSNQHAGDLLKGMLSFSSPPSLINAN